MSRSMTRATWKMASKEKIYEQKQNQEQQARTNTTGMSSKIMKGEKRKRRQRIIK